MTPDPCSRVPARRRTLKLPRRRALAGAGALTALSLAAAACSGGDRGATSHTRTADSEAMGAAPAPSGDFMATRPGAGIAAAGGNPRTVRGDNPCNQTGGADPITISYVGANLAQLDAVGLEALVIEEPGLIIDAYTNEVNFNGGINGHCVEFVPHLYSLTDPVASFTQICTDLLTAQPIFYMSLRLINPVVQCATIGGQIPTLGLYAFASSAVLEQTGDRLYLDDGTVEHLLSASLDVALSSRVINTSSPIGLLHSSSATAGMDISQSEAIIMSFGLNQAAAADLPTVFGDLQLLLWEKRVRLLEGGLSDDEAAEAQRNLATLTPEAADLFGQIEQFYLEAANRFKDAGVTAVAASADWTDVRRMMRAAELVDWYPTWIANDIQPATIVLADAPRAQAENLVLVSNRRAVGDEVPALDRGCITLRNTASTASPFAHRLHTDAWTLITATCDYLDVAFAAMTNVQGDITADTFVEALNSTQYDTQHGGLITFAPADPNGSKRFRVLQADPGCVLNFWGCMRATTDWLTPANTVGVSAG